MPSPPSVEELPAARTRDANDVLEIRSRGSDGADDGAVERTAPEGEQREAASPVARAGQTGPISVLDLLAGIVLPAMLFAGALTYRLRRERP